MKKIILATIISLSISIFTSGCSNLDNGIDVEKFSQNTSTTNNTQSANDEFIDSTLGSYNTGIIYEPFDFASLGPEYQAFMDTPVDVDVMNLNDLLAFAQVYNMMTEYDMFLGQSVKVHGNYYRHDIEDMDLSYHFLLLVDGTNCCTGILEFLMGDGLEYPDSGEDLMLMGEYSVYTDEYGTYPCIIVSEYLLY